MERHLRPEPLGHPAGQPLHLVVGVVPPGDEQGGQLGPDAGLLDQVLQRLQHRRQVGEAELLVEAVGEGLEVDVGRVHAGEQLATRLGADVAVGHRHRLEASGPAGLGHVDGILGEDHRVVVGEGHAAAAPGQRLLGDAVAGGLVAEPILLGGLGDVPVLAEAAAQVAAGGAEGEDAGAGVEVGQRLLLDGIDAEAAGASPGGEHQLVTYPLAHEAEGPLPIVEAAGARAEVALETPVVEPVPPAGGVGGDGAHGASR